MDNAELPKTATPILDSVLANLEPTKAQLKMEIELGPVVAAKERLLEKLFKNVLTLSDIEQELADLPNIVGIETGKQQIVKTIKLNLPHECDGDIKKLPAQ